MTNRGEYHFAQSVDAYWHHLAIDGRFVRAVWYVKRCPGHAEWLGERPMGDTVDSAGPKSNQIMGWSDGKNTYRDV